MHQHSASAAVLVNDGHTKLTLPEAPRRITATKPTTRLGLMPVPENAGDTPLEVIVIK